MRVISFACNKCGQVFSPGSDSLGYMFDGIPADDKICCELVTNIDMTAQCYEVRGYKDCPSGRGWCNLAGCFSVAGCMDGMGFLS